MATGNPTPAAAGPVRIPPPVTVLIAGAALVLQGLGLVALAVAVLISGLHDHADTGQLLAQVAYYVIIGLLLAAVARGLAQGRRWARTPGLVAELVLIAVGIWMIGPSAHPLWGAAMIVVGLATGALLTLGPAQRWIASFPSLWGQAE